MFKHNQEGNLLNQRTSFYLHARQFDEVGYTKAYYVQDV